MNKFNNFFKSVEPSFFQEETSTEEKQTEKKVPPPIEDVKIETDPEKGSSLDDFPKGPSGENIETSKEVENNEEETHSTGEFTITSFLAKLIESGEFTEEELNEKFEDSLEGLEQINELRIAKREKEAEAKAFSELSDDAKRIIELDKQGVDIRQILEFEAEEVDYNSIDLDDVENQQDLYYNYLIETGLTEEKAAKKVNLSFESGDLAEDAKDAVDFLSKKQNAAKDQLIATQKAEAKRNQDEAKAQYENWVKGVAETKQIKGFEISKAEAAKLLDFMTKPVDKSGKTQEQLAWEDPETRKAFNYFVMKKFDFKAVEKQAETKAAIKMKAKVANITDKGLSSKGTKNAVPEEKSNPAERKNYFRNF